MKLLQGQKHITSWRNYDNLTTIALDDLSEANGLVKAALGDESFLKASFDECMKIMRANVGRGAKRVPGNINVNGMRDNLEEALREIEHGDPTINAEASKLAEEYAAHAKEIEPSLTVEQSYRANEDGELWDAGKIASHDPMAFFAPGRTERPKSGRGDGAFRILINTDVSWWGDPTSQCAALMAVTLLLQRQCPVEIWTQQAWLGNHSTDGVTLFKVFSGAVVQPQNIYFWIGSEHKDSPYSYIVNKMLHRQSSGVSVPPEIPCDLYVYGQFMPRLKDHDAWSEWVAKTAKPMLFDEEMPDGWSGYLSKLPT